MTSEKSRGGLGKQADKESEQNGPPGGSSLIFLPPGFRDSGLHPIEESSSSSQQSSNSAGRDNKPDTPPHLGEQRIEMSMNRSDFQNDGCSVAN